MKHHDRIPEHADFSCLFIASSMVCFTHTDTWMVWKLDISWLYTYMVAGREILFQKLIGKLEHFALILYLLFTPPCLD